MKGRFRFDFGLKYQTIFDMHRVATWVVVQDFYGTVSSIASM